MPRIRTIKPEFFRSPSTAKVDPLVRLFYQALWCWADDFGIGETNVYGWLGFAFPDDQEVYDPELRGFRALSAQDLRRFCADCAQHYEVTFYIVRERHYYAIPHWDQHQKTERRNDRRKFPTPDDPEAVPDLQFHASADDARICAGKPAQNLRKIGAGTGEQGNRGTGEQGKKETGGHLERVPHVSNARAREKTREKTDELIDVIPAPNDTFELATAERGLRRSPPVTIGATRLVAAVVRHGVIPDADRTMLRIKTSEGLNQGRSDDDMAECLRIWLTKNDLGPGALLCCLTEVDKRKLNGPSGVDGKGAGWLSMMTGEEPHDQSG